MSVTDEAVAASRDYTAKFNLGHLPMPPARRLAVVACMDARITVERILGLETGDAHIIRNAGGILTDDAVRSLIISHHLLGTKEFVFIHHTDCGMLTFKGHDLAAQLKERTGAAAVAPASFHAFSNVEEDLRLQMDRARSHPWIPREIPIRGFVYDVTSGNLTEVQSPSTP